MSTTTKARSSGTLLNDLAYGRGASQPMLDVTAGGGTHGYSVDNRTFINNQAYIRKNLFCLLLEAPLFFSLMPEPSKWVGTLKAMVELHPERIQGLNSTLEVQFDEHLVGGAGEVQEEPTDVKRARSQPVFELVEKYGLPFQTFLHNWITYGIMDPETKYALVGTLAPDKRPKDMLANWYTATMLFIEPDPTHTKVVRAWLCTNMMPKGTGPIEGSRELGSASELLRLSIEFTALTSSSLGVNLMAQRILDEINIVNSNPYLRPAFVQGRDPDVAAIDDTVGYRANANTLGESAVPGLGIEASNRNI